jgi:UDP-N-acetylmuramoyl-tripeptide--D-alanyl-D-alanine ligase
MSALTAREIATRCAGTVEGDDDAAVKSWAFDSRALEPGACFVALRDQRDGHDFVPAAFDSGASVAIVDHGLAPSFRLPLGRALVHAPDTLAALQSVARSRRIERPDLRVVAVAGSTGKTSTKDLLAAVLAPLGCYANAESYNNEFGLPLTICNTPDAATVLVTEMGERKPRDLELLASIARPETAVITNVGLAHAEYLGGPQGVVDVLGELLGALPPDGVAVCNADDPATAELAKLTDAQMVTVGLDERATYRVEAVAVDKQLRASFDLGGERFNVPLHGAHHAANAALAVVTAYHVFGMPFVEAATELGNATASHWRMELLETDDGVTILNDSYNANPTSMEAALLALAHLPTRGRRIAVLGEMRELGAHAVDAHRAVGARAEELGIDALIVVGAAGALIADAAPTLPAARVADAREALAALERDVHSGDAVLCKASRAVGLEAVADGLLARHRNTAQGAAS